MAPCFVVVLSVKLAVAFQSTVCLSSRVPLLLGPDLGPLQELDCGEEAVRGDHPCRAVGVDSDAAGAEGAAHSHTDTTTCIELLETYRWASGLSSACFSAEWGLRFGGRIC